MQKVARSKRTFSLVKDMSTVLASLKTRWLRTTRSRTIIVGVNALTRLLATELEAAGKGVSLIDLESRALADGNEGDQLLLLNSGAKAGSCFLAATPIDVRNLSLCRTARLTFRVPTVIARLGLLGGTTSWARLNEAGMARMSWSDLVSAILGTVTPSRGLARVARATEREQVTEVELLTPVYLGRTIADLGLDGCEVIALRRDNSWVATLDLAQMRRGDMLTLVGTKAAINKVRESFTSL